MTSDKQNLRKNLMAQRKAHHRAHGATAGDKLVEQFLAHSILPADHLTLPPIYRWVARLIRDL